jgi:peptidoglycan/LPS O-acetylase OafA/YrhL
MKNIFKINISHDRVYGLDILRCLAILFVVLGHGNRLVPQEIAVYLGFIVLDGVSIFFVLSGFLIGGILIKQFEKKGIDFKMIFDFWKRRWFRTLPNYFLILCVLSALHLMFTNDFTLSSISSYFIFSQNLFTAHPNWFFPEAWSLSIEEWFYLLVPIIVLVMFYAFKLSKRKAIFYTAISIVLLVTFFRLYRYYTVGVVDWDLVYRKQVFTRLDSLMFGVIGSYISYYYNPHWMKYKVPLLITGIFLLFLPKIITTSYYSNLYISVFSFTVNALATLFVMPYLSDYKVGKGLVFTVITYVSLISYSMYLINLSLVQNWILLKIDLKSLGISWAILRYFLYWVLTVGLSILIYKYYEIPMTSLRDKVNLFSGEASGSTTPVKDVKSASNENSIQ